MQVADKVRRRIVRVARMPVEADSDVLGPVRARKLSGGVGKARAVDSEAEDVVRPVVRKARDVIGTVENENACLHGISSGAPHGRKGTIGECADGCKRDDDDDGMKINRRGPVAGGCNTFRLV